MTRHGQTYRPPSGIEPRRIPLRSAVEEAIRLVSVAEMDNVAARLLGGTAIQLVARAAGVQHFAREPLDIDLVCRRDAGGRVEALLTKSGYRPDEQFNAMNGHRRLLFFDDTRGRQVDVFVGAFAMCHEIPLEGRLEVARTTLPLAELLLMKLQIIELNAKDQTDILGLLAAAEVGDHDRQAINGRYIAELCSCNWGLWKTVNINLERTRIAASRINVPDSVRAAIEDRLGQLEAMLEAAPKSRKWRLRARVGERVRWYEEPEEVS